MKQHAFAAAIVFAVSAASMNGSSAEPLQTMDDVGQAIAACWKPASDWKGTVTLSFSFKRDGTLIGAPQPTNIAVDGDEKAREQFVGSAIGAIESCMPLTFSSGLAAGIGGQVFTMPFTAPKSGQDQPTVDTQ
ncbi:MAG: hypothetical protein AAAB35_22425 [Phyllobacterium sp.]|uniref:hypothetical protein n=1 Tax=Phyllobacterium sp. TaxID=1871046 RepID=UPI0030F333B3